MTSSKPKIAIAVQKYYHPGQTFVNRHLRHLFDGNSCVIAERHYKAEPDGFARPVFFMSDALKNWQDMARLPVVALHNRKTHFGYRVPFGNNRKALISYLEAQGADAILSEFGSQSMLVADIGKEMGLPVFCYFRGRDASFWIHNEMRVNAYRKIFPELAGIFAVSQFLLDNLASVGLSHPNAHVVPSGTDIDLFRPAKKDPNLVVAVGRFVAKKYPELTIRAFLEAKKDFPDARLEMIGGGPLLKASREFYEAQNAPESIVFHGQKDSGFIAERLSKAAAFLQHSVTDASGEAEGLPSSIQEAMAAGCAIVSTRHAGIPELVIEHETGLLSPELDEAGFAQNIKAIFENPKATAHMGANARTLALEKIDYRKLYAKVETIIQASLIQASLENSSN